MKNTKKVLSTGIALAIILFASIRISAMFSFGTPSQPQQQQQQPSTGSFSGFGNQPQSKATFGSAPSQPQPQTQTRTFGFGSQTQPQTQPTFGGQPQPQATTPTFGSTLNQPVSPLLKVYFSPQDQIVITNKLFNLIDNAKKQLYIAIYYITDNAIIEKIIAAKRRNVDVQIVIDESSPEIESIIMQLLDNNIMPIIYPSNNIDPAGKMHHKFVAIDDMVVFTGSANFTKIVLNSKTRGFNFENVLIINSTDIAKQFINAFVAMKKEIFDFYVKTISSKALNALPSWMKRVIPRIYQQQDLMQQSVNQPIKNYNPEEQEKINNFFNIQSTEIREDRITDPQKKLLNMNGFTNREILTLSKQEASDLITKVKSGNWVRTTQEQRATLRSKGYSGIQILMLSSQEASKIINRSLSTEIQKNPIQITEIREKRIQPTERREDNMTMPQKRLLNINGFSDQEISGLSKKEASDLITKVKSGYWERATEKQRALLKNKGFLDQDILFLSKNEASGLISQVLDRGKQQYSW